MHDDSKRSVDYVLEATMFAHSFIRDTPSPVAGDSVQFVNPHTFVPDNLKPMVNDMFLNGGIGYMINHGTTLRLQVNRC